MILVAAFTLAAACLPIDAPSDRITAGDLARPLPAWSSVSPDAAIAIAPAPGFVRVLHPAELRRLAGRFEVTSNVDSDVCFTLATQAIPPERILAAMQMRLPGAEVKLLQASRAKAPAGVLDFPLAGLRQGYWAGHVTYGAGHKFPLWARVDVRIAVKRVVASADLKPGQPIEAADLRIETVERAGYTASRQTEADALEDVVGRVSRRSIPAGAVVRREWLEALKVIHRGETVKVEVLSDSTRLEGEAIADAAGAVGDVISVQNVDSKRRFRARVESPGRVSVRSGK